MEGRGLGSTKRQDGNGTKHCYNDIGSIRPPAKRLASSTQRGRRTQSLVAHEKAFWLFALSIDNPWRSPFWSSRVGRRGRNPFFSALTLLVGLTAWACNLRRDRETRAHQSDFKDAVRSMTTRSTNEKKVNRKSPTPGPLAASS